VITALVVAAIARTRLELLDERATAGAGHRTLETAAYGLVVSLGLALFVAPFASGWPDGLERAAAALGFEHRAAAEPLLASPLPDYAAPGIGSAALSTVIAGCAGTVAAFGLAYLLARVLTPRRSRNPAL